MMMMMMMTLKHSILLTDVIKSHTHTHIYIYIYIYIYMNKPNLVLDNQQWLICHITKPNEPNRQPLYYLFICVFLKLQDFQTHICLLKTPILFYLSSVSLVLSPFFKVTPSFWWSSSGCSVDVILVCIVDIPRIVFVYHVTKLFSVVFYNVSDFISHLKTIAHITYSGLVRFHGISTIFDARSAGSVEYTKCISADGSDPQQRVYKIWH